MSIPRVALSILSIVDLREDELLLQTERVVTSAVEGISVDTSEVAYTGESNVEQSVEELVHDLSPLSVTLTPMTMTLSELEVSD